LSGILAAHQPNYLPYLGLLHKAARADVIVLQDDLKYIKNDFGNRNRIQAEDSWRWLSIPVSANNSSLFNTVYPAEAKWPREHANILRSKYGRAAHKDRLEPYLAALAEHAADSLSVINIALIEKLFEEFAIETPVVIEGEFDDWQFDNPNDRLIALCKRFDCDRYLSGIGATAYIDPERWEGSGVRLEWSDYEQVPYERGGQPWIPNLSAIDAIVHVDAAATLIA
jgi:hypothetical protein